MDLSLMYGNYSDFCINENTIINEDIMDVVDNAVEIVAGAIGFIPFAGDTADVAMVLKNIAQKDYLGAALFAIAAIPEPTDLTDLISKTLRFIQKIASTTGQEDKVNEMIGWLAKKAGGDPIATTRQAWAAVDKKIKNTSQTANVAVNKTDNDKEKKAIGAINKVTAFIEKNWDAMTKALFDFLDLIQKKIDDLKEEPIAGADNIPDYVDDLTNKYRSNYDKLFMADGAKKAMAYKEQIRKKAKGDKAKENAYNKAFMRKQNGHTSIQ